MTQAAHGAYLQCCNGFGYWSNVAPLDGYRLPRRGDYWLYINTARWPRGMKAVNPPDKVS